MTVDFNFILDMSPTIYNQENIIHTKLTGGEMHSTQILQLQGQPMAADLNFIVNDMSSFRRYVTYNLTRKYFASNEFWWWRLTRKRSYSKWNVCTMNDIFRFFKMFWFKLLSILFSIQMSIEKGWWNSFSTFLSTCARWLNSQFCTISKQSM
jgi:hypothetical protein